MRTFKDSLIWQTLMSPNRQYVMDRINKPLLKAIVIIANRLPEMTRENCLHPNTLILFDIWDKFRKRNGVRREFIDAGFRILIYKHEVDPVYRHFLNKFLKGTSDWDYNEKAN